jgi:hypothetical protein
MNRGPTQDESGELDAVDLAAMLAVEGVNDRAPILAWVERQLKRHPELIEEVPEFHRLVELGLIRLPGACARCSGCGGENDRAARGQRYCRRCHAAANRTHRLKQSHERRELLRHLAALLEKVS